MKRLLLVLLALSPGASAFPTDCPANITLTVRNGELVLGPQRTDLPPNYPLRVTIAENVRLRDPIIISLCGTDARLDISRP